MIQPNDVMNIDSENWEDFKKEAMKDALYYNGPGDLLDTEEGRARFCRLNETGVFRKPDPDFPNYKIWVFNNQGSGHGHQKAQPRGPGPHGGCGVRRGRQGDQPLL